MPRSSIHWRDFLSLAVVNEDVQIGDVLNLVLGEPDDTDKTSTETHVQIKIRMHVSPTPYAVEARENYAESWRNKSD